MDDPNRKKQNQLLLTSGFNRQNLEIGTVDSKAKSLLVRKNPRAALLWIGEVENANSTDDFNLSASITGKLISDFENLDFNVASRFKSILTGNFKKQVTTAEGKAKSEKRSLTRRQVAWMICDFHTIGDDNEPFGNFRDLSNVQLKNDNVQASDTKWDEILSAVTGRPTDSILESLHKSLIEKSRNDTWRQERRLLQIEVFGPKTISSRNSKILIHSGKSRQTCKRGL